MADSPRPELLSFLAAIKEQPEEDTPKLALADWLQEQPGAADNARGEFLRAFVRNNQLAKTDPAREDFGALSRLWNAHETAWAGRLKAAGFKVWATNHMFRWGLLFPALDWHRHEDWDEAILAAAEEYAWVAGVAVRAADAKAGIGFVNSALFPSLIGLRVVESDGARGLIGRLCETDRIHRLRSLELAFVFARVSGIAQSPQLGALRHLAVRSFSLANEFGYLSDSPCLNELRALDVSGTGLDANAGRAFAAGTGLPALEELNFGPSGYDRNRLGDEGVIALAAGVWSGRLKRLNLASNDITEAGAAALVVNPHMHNLTHLDLSGNRLSNSVIDDFAHAEHLKTLEVLNLSNCGLTGAAATALATSPYMANIRRLDLRGNTGIGKKGRAALRERFGDRVVLDPQ
jgi:uncharacterized protein (TIGR02996 family)